ncbi:prepilin peptidase [Brevibacillus agri]|uniref:prepilin peptidase n=1 Tax=Brevibacillus agri TaxID=51101 RepID=UPI00047167F5|nr:A24 family peptidase [Brevibacillus agri]MED4570670.1 prepilin peptidase [Brevibacillus agri]WHX31484.1 prepilin peptidase [Brevibacillus agri]
MLQLPLSISFFLLGLLFGSFYNVVGLRVPKKQSIIYPPSHCPTCKRRLLPGELIPVISYLLAKGRCKGCKTAISPLYPVMEGLTGLGFVLVYLRYDLTWETLLGMLFVSLLSIITVADLTYRLIPNKVLLLFFLLFLVMRFFWPYGDASYVAHLIGMAAGFLFFFLLAVITRGGMGGGDTKLFAVIGMFLSPTLLFLTVFLSSAFGAMYGLFLLAIRRATRKSMIPFGPFIALGAVTAYLYGSAIVDWYLSFY